MFRFLSRSFSGEVDTSPLMRRCYAGAAGIYAQRPRAVAFPEDAADVLEALGFCRHRRLPLTARGAGSGMAGNNVGRGLVLDFTRHLNRVLCWDPEAAEIVVQPGLTYDALNECLRPHGRFLPPNPSSGAFCTLGGMVASNSSGMRSVKYGPIAPWVVGIRGVWGTGEVFDARRPSGPAPASPTVPGRQVQPALEELFRGALPPCPSWVAGVLKNSSGLRVWEAWDGDRLDTVELLVSSEGTLGLFTEIALRTAALPGGRATLLAAFDSLDAMAAAVDLLRPLSPSGVEFLDRTFLEPLRLGNAFAREVVPHRAEAVLLVELEGNARAAAAQAGRDALELIAGVALPGARLASSIDQADALWALRRGASPSLARLHPGRAAHQFVEDCAVPPERLPGLLRGLRRIFADEGVPVVLFGHAGEAHVHANPLLDPTDRALPRRIESLAGRVCALVEELEGTLSGEHGDGLARAAFARRRFGSAAGFFAAVRRVCDPDALLNPGKILPVPGWSTAKDLRHPWERRSLAARALRGPRAARRAQSSRALPSPPASSRPGSR